MIAYRRLIPNLVILVFALLICDQIKAEGTKQLSPADTNEVMLQTNIPLFGDFAAFDGPTISRLNIRITDWMTDTVYLGLSCRSNENGILGGSGLTTYTFRIKAPDGSIVHSGIISCDGIIGDTANANTWQLASAGPDVLNPAGYSTAEAYSTFIPSSAMLNPASAMQNGDFYIEFDNIGGAPSVFIKWFDVTVVRDGLEQPGRLWSNLWSLRTPSTQQPPNFLPPDCEWDREFNGAFYTYTTDQFVSRIDFLNSGFKGLSFNVAFNSTGPGSTGEILIDRQSINNAAGPSLNSDHMVFLNIPDDVSFPSPPSLCGVASIVSVTCVQDSFCVEVGVTSPGQVELILDFFGDNQTFDPGTEDVLLATSFPVADTSCIFWDGKNGNGMIVPPGNIVPAIIRYAQGVQHYAAWDVEKLETGFCVETISPSCPGGFAFDSVLYWDDSNIVDNLGTLFFDESLPVDTSGGAISPPKVQLDGCTCKTETCRRWTNFEVGGGSNCQGAVFGFGDTRILNTWWFASQLVSSPFSLPVIGVVIDGGIGDPATICPGDSIELVAQGTPDSIPFIFTWTGPNGFTANTANTGFVMDSGLYIVTIMDPVTMCIAMDSVTVMLGEAPTSMISFTCVGANSQNANVELTVSGGAPPYSFMWSNGDTTQNLDTVPPGLYIVTVTDTNGCFVLDTVLVEGCCDLMFTCPPMDGGTFACLSELPAQDSFEITFIEFCDSVDITITDFQLQQSGDGCAGDPIIIERTYTIIDAAGNFGQCVQQFTFTDTIPPVPDTIFAVDTLQLECASDVPTAFDLEAFDNCGDTITASPVDVVSDSNCVDQFTLTRTWTFADACNNIDTSMQVYVVLDTVLPVPDTTFATDTVNLECAADVPAPFNITFTDNCNSATFTSGAIIAVQDSSCENQKTVIYEWPLSDACGNVDTLIQVYVVNDITPPVPDTVFASDTVFLECGLDIPDPFNVTATDNCDGTFTASPIEETLQSICLDQMTVKYSWIFNDLCNNSDTIIQVYAVLDTIAPAPGTPLAADTLTFDCGSQVPAPFTIEFFDNCGEPSLVMPTDVVSDSNCTNQLTISRTWTAQDDCGNTGTVVQTYVVNDSIAPSMSCPPPVTFECGTTFAILPSQTLDDFLARGGTASDNCGLDTLSFSFVGEQALLEGCPDTLIWTFQIADECGNTATCTRLIVIDDTIMPVMICPPFAEIDCSIDSLPPFMDLEEFLAAGGTANDLCALDSVTFSFAFASSDNMTCPETISRTYTLSDECGNTTSCEHDVLVDDGIAPVLSCPPDTTILCSEAAFPAFSSLDDFIMAGGSASDNCELDSSSLTLIISGIMMISDCEDLITRTYQILDPCRNPATCSQNILVTDTVPPLVACPPDGQAQCSAAEVPVFQNLNDFLNAGGTATDDCGLNISSFSFLGEVSDGMTCPETVTRTYSISDDCGNISTCTHTIIVDDTTPPQFMLTQPLERDLQQGLAVCDLSEVPVFANFDDFLAGGGAVSDNCELDTLSFSYVGDVSDGSTCPETITRTYSIADICGNISTCVQEIIVNDTIAPVLMCPDIDTVECTADLVMTFNNIQEFLNAGGFLFDNCAIDSSSFSLVGMNMPAQDCPATVSMTYQVADSCGNTSTCTRLVLVIDDENPVLTCPPTAQIECLIDSFPPYVMISELVNVGGTASDNCMLDTMSFGLINETSDGNICPGNYTRTYSIDDLCGNTSTCIQIIIVDDTTPPVAICQDITLEFSSEFDITILPEEVDGGSTDNCSPISLSLSDSTFNCQEFGGTNQMTITLTVEDICGNSSSCEATVFGEGGGLELECPPDLCIFLDPGECETIVNYVVNAFSPCGDEEPVIVQIDTSGLTSGDFFPIGTTVQQYMAYNEAGDTLTCEFTITIKEFDDPRPPACNDDVNISVDADCEAFINPDIILEGGPYRCYDNYLVEIEGVGSGLGGVLITSEQVGDWLSVTVTDPETGISCWGNIHIEDKIPPIIECIDVTLPCGESTDPIFVDPIIGNTTDQASPGSPIGPAGGTVTLQELTINAPANAEVTDVNITIDLNHTWSSDLDVFLIGPDGSIVELATDVCGGTDDWSDVTFDDAGGIDVNSACSGATPALTDTVQPEGLLSDFNGTLAAGTWILEITDDVGGDGGTLNSVSLDVSYFVSLPYAAVAFDACGPVELTYEDDESGDVCEGSQILRKWTAVDESGNVATCLQTITIDPLTLETLEFPGTYTGNCGGNSHPEVTGWPLVDGVPIIDSRCNIFAGYYDQEISDCGAGIKIVRTWTVLDWCTQQVEEGTQIIKLTDNEGPILTCPENRLYSADPWFCVADVSLDKPYGIDACGTPFTMTPVVPEGIGTLVSFGNNYVWNDVPYGEWTITWVAEDACGNSSSCTYVVEVVDDIPPVAVCDEHTIVSLTFDDPLDEGLTKVSADIFDDGSYDNCSDITFTARRMDSCIDFDWTTNGAGVDEIPNGIVNSRDRGTVHRPLVPFSCCDVGAGPIMVELAVIDGYGNTNFCMVEVEVQDKLAPYIECPPNVFVTCDFWFDAQETAGFVDQNDDVLTPVFGRTLDAYEYDESDRQPVIINDPGNQGLPQPWQWGYDGFADDNCDVNITVRVRIFDDCSGGDVPPATTADLAGLCAQFGASSEDCADLAAQINSVRVRLVERTFKAEDNQGNSSTCKQKIWVIDRNPFFITDETCNNPNPNDGVIWPCDILLDDCPSGELTPEDLGSAPVIFDDNCSLVGVTYSDQRFDFVEGACFKIIRTWTVIDWCQYDAVTGEGYWEYVQVIKVLDDQGVDFLDCPEGAVEFCVEDPNVELPPNNQVFLGENDPNASSCSAHISMQRTFVETCSDWVEYDVKVYPYNGSDYIQVVPKTQITLDSDTAVLNFDTKTSPVFAVRQYGLPYNSRYCDDQYYHRILWSVEDGCGNLSTCEYLFRLEDCKKPSPVCINGLSTVVMPSSGKIEIWAIDFNASSFDDCTAASDLLYSFSGDSYQPSRTFTCDDIEENGGPSFIVEIWAADEGNDENCDGSIKWPERNKDFCTTFIIVDDNEGVCGSTGSVGIGGTIETVDLESVENVEVNFESGSTTFPIFTTTGTGEYYLVNLPVGEDYSITPGRDDDHKNGVSTLDLVRIQKHLLGMDPFTSPYKFIAADANNSNSVSAVDILELRKLLLGIYTELPDNTSWRFVNKIFEFADPLNPWPFEEEIQIPQLIGMSMDNDFIGVKVGDVNGSVQANATMLEERSGNDVLTLLAEDRIVKAGEVIQVAFRLKESTDLIGYQFTLKTDGLAFLGYEKGTAEINNTHFGILQDAVTTSFHQLVPMQIDAGEILFGLMFKAHANGRLSEMLELNSHYTIAEAYNPEEEVQDIHLSFVLTETISGIPAFNLYQNEPNPFRTETTVRFELPEDMPATISVYDLSGKMLSLHEGDFAKGYNEVKFNRKELQGTGVLYYRLDAEQYRATKKMLLIDQE